MQISKSSLKDACSKIGLDETHSLKLWQELEKDNSTKFNLENLAYYFGALIIMAAMAWFMGNAWDSLDGLGISLLGLVYFALFLLTGWHFWFQKKLLIPGGLLITVALSMIPIIVFGIEKYTGFWPIEALANYEQNNEWIKRSWVIMEIATVLAGLSLLKFVRFPFLIIPIVIAFWRLCLDLSPLLIGLTAFTSEQERLLTMYFGLTLLFLSYFIDRKTEADFAFWSYLLGMLAFWIALSLTDTDSELDKFLYFLINLFFVFISVIIQRRVFIIFGSVGIFYYLGHLAAKVFEDSLLFPIALSILGVLIIYLGLLYNRNKEKIEQKIMDILPEYILNLNPERRIK